jgi:hypothetical protein
MTEGEVMEQVVSYMSLLLAGVSIIFTVVSTYIVALNYFVGDANFVARLGAFAFVSLILLLLLVVMVGAQSAHDGLIARLIELQAEGALTAAGESALRNASNGVDDAVRILTWVGMLAVFAALGYMTFIHRWRPDVVNVQIQSKKAAS